MAREYLIITIESAYKTIKSTPTINTEYVPIRLDQDNAFTMRAVPAPWVIRSADTYNHKVLTGSERTVCSGRVVTYLYATQAPMLLKWALQPINAGQTAPWTTTELPDDLASCCIDHTFIYPTTASTAEKRRYLGVKVMGGSLTCDNQSDLVRLSLDLIGAVPQGNTFDASSDPTPTEPALADFATDPYAFQDTSGGTGLFKIGATTTNYSRFALTWRNMLDSRFDESRFLSSSRLRGRDIDFEAAVLLKNSPHRRDLHEVMTAQDAEVLFDNGTKSCKIDFHGKNYTTAVDDNLALDKQYEQVVKLANYRDIAQTEAISLIFT